MPSETSSSLRGEILLPFNSMEKLPFTPMTQDQVLSHFFRAELSFKLVSLGSLEISENISPKALRGNQPLDFKLSTV